MEARTRGGHARIATAAFALLLMAVGPTSVEATHSFYLYAPWPAGVTMDVGGNGYYYGEGGHTGKSHYAVDINGLGGGNTDCGTPILAAHSGTVSVGESSSAGTYVKIQHASGFTTLYAHLSAATVTAGMEVSHGRKVGLMGTTGNSDYCHLHFVLRDSSGTSVPPSPMSGQALYKGRDVTSGNVMDATLPAVAWATPASGALLRGSVALKVSATDAGGIHRVVFSVSGTWICTDTTPTDGRYFGCAWDTATTPGGSHTLRAVAVDTSGNQASAYRGVKVDNTGPTVTLTRPVSGRAYIADQEQALPEEAGGETLVVGSLTVKATASDASGINYVELLIDNQSRSKDTTSSYAMVWDTTLDAPGPHRVAVRAVDMAGNARSRWVDVVLVK